MRKRVDCKKADKCNAPLCPLDEQSLLLCVWYPGEEICTCREFANLDFIKTQKKISKVLGIGRPNNEPKFDVGYFTLDMLNHKFKITNKIVGLDPNEDEKAQLNKWFKRYKGFSKKRSKKLDSKKAKNRD